MFACSTVVCHVIRSNLFPNTAEKELGQLRIIIRTLLGIILPWKEKKKKLCSTVVGYNIALRLDYVFILLTGHYICRTFCWSETGRLVWQVLLVCNNSSISMGWIDLDSWHLREDFRIGLLSFGFSGVVCVFGFFEFCFFFFFFVVI